MKPVTLLFLFAVLSVQAQTRVEISGQVISNTNEVDRITVYNTNSKQGTITNTEGHFLIEAKQGDTLQVSAVQFKKVTAVVSEKVITSKTLEIHLDEQINQLDEVLLRSVDLTGNLIVDLENVETKALPEIDLGGMDLEPLPQVATEFDRLTKKGQLYNGMDFALMLGWLAKTIFPKKRKNKEKKYATNQKTILSIYSREFISETFKIPDAHINAFLAFVEDESFDKTLLDKENEMLLLELMLSKSKEFLRLSSEKK